MCKRSPNVRSRHMQLRVSTTPARGFGAERSQFDRTEARQSDRYTVLPVCCLMMLVQVTNTSLTQLLVRGAELTKLDKKKCELVEWIQSPILSAELVEWNTEPHPVCCLCPYQICLRPLM